MVWRLSENEFRSGGPGIIYRWGTLWAYSKYNKKILDLLVGKRFKRTVQLLTGFRQFLTFSVCSTLSVFFFVIWEVIESPRVGAAIPEELHHVWLFFA